MIGTLSDEMLAALLETIPIEFSIVDKDDKVVAWNKHATRIFRRPLGTIGKDVRNCHPKKSLDLVEKILAEMKAGTRDKARFWIDLHLEGKERPQKILIEYYALRDEQGNYLGCLEATQNITEIQALSGQKRLLDQG
ncbi:MAG: PAS domain-containing protein [candidate division KSB1 bacterium]|nr:PAS domain-containing protein [candidate division KSB1 bacterium]MDZ7412320.1 PAS domain-containing protein [candidate division KSB1 bacterium]